MFVIFLLVCVVMCMLLFQITKKKFDYWEKQKVPHIKPIPILGNYGEYILLRKFIGAVVQEICMKFPHEPYVGAFYGTEPAIIIKDPELIKLVMTKDFYFFNSREISQYSDKELATRNIFNHSGDHWKVIRQNMTPLFSTAKMKNMFHLIEKCTYGFEKLLNYESTIAEVIEIRRNLMGRYTMACISSCVFGVDVGSMDKDYKENPFTLITNMVLNSSKLIGFKVIARAVWPGLFYGLGFKTFSTKVDDFFKKFLTSVFEDRKYKPTARHDFVDLLLNLKLSSPLTGDSITNMRTGGDKKIELHVTDEILVSQCALFFTAGFETSATTMSYALFELAKDSVAQKKVHEEIDGYLLRHGNKLYYDCVSELPYTEACLDEVLRLYPVLGILTREVVEDYTLPSGVHLEKGMRVHIPVYHLHHHPEYFPDPEEFKPERFLQDEKRKVKPYTYMPFGEGLRVCIGMRFAKMQMLPGLVTILKKFQVDLAEGTPRRLHFDPNTLVTTPVQPILLKLTPREGWEKRILA